VAIGAVIKSTPKAGTRRALGKNVNIYARKK
jgi:beta-lactam-binding protein with PASTA domain